MSEAASKKPARNIGLLLLFCVLVLNIVFMPRQIIPGDPTAWRQETRSLILQHHLWVDPAVVAASGQEPGQYFDYNPVDGHWYSKYGLANSLMSLPPMLIDPDPGVVILNAWNILLTLCLAATLYCIALRYTDRAWLAAGLVLAMLYCTYLWYYQRAQSGEIYQVLFFALLYEFLLRGLQHQPAVSAFSIVAAWLFAALLVFSRLFFAVLLPVMIFTISWVLWRRRYSLLRAAALVLAPPVIILLLLAWINDVKFGSPLLSGYHQWRPEEHLLTGNWWDGISGMLFSAHWSIFIYFPILLFSLFGAHRFAARYPMDAAFLYTTFLIAFFLLAKIPTWRGEWTYGARYLIFILPILAMPALLVFERWRFSLWLTALVLLPSLWAQWQVNRSDFWLFYIAYQPLQPLHDPAIDRYFYGRPEAVLYWQVRRGDDDFLFRRLQSELPPRAVADYRRVLGDALSDSNLYWFQR